MDKQYRAVIDYSNIEEGYFIVKYLAETDKRLKVKVIGPSITYTYDLAQGEWTTFSLSDSNGRYQVKIYRQTESNKYAVILSKYLNVTLDDEFVPFLCSNQYVNYKDAIQTTTTANDIAENIDDPIKKVEAIYKYVVNNFTYDTEKAKNVKSGYLPDLDLILSEKKGICFDYAALMVGMLRSQDIPCKLIIGYAGDVYHAWVSVWIDDVGWIDGMVQFDGKNWKRMDPTFISNNNNKKIYNFVNNDSNYNGLYIY